MKRALLLLLLAACHKKPAPGADGGVEAGATDAAVAATPALPASHLTIEMFDLKHEASGPAFAWIDPDDGLKLKVFPAPGDAGDPAPSCALAMDAAAKPVTGITISAEAGDFEGAGAAVPVTASTFNLVSPGKSETNNQGLTGSEITVTKLTDTMLDATIDKKTEGAISGDVHATLCKAPPSRFGGPIPAGASRLTLLQGTKPRYESTGRAYAWPDRKGVLIVRVVPGPLEPDLGCDAAQDRTTKFPEGTVLSIIVSGWKNKPGTFDINGWGFAEYKSGSSPSPFDDFPSFADNPGAFGSLPGDDFPSGRGGGSGHEYGPSTGSTFIVTSVSKTALEASIAQGSGKLAGEIHATMCAKRAKPKHRR